MQTEPYDSLEKRSHKERQETDLVALIQQIKEVIKILGRSAG